MNPIQEVYNAALKALEADHLAYEQEIISRVILAAESPRRSKRELLGMEKKHKKAELPLFAEKKLF
jgi:hypothetical protein